MQGLGRWDGVGGCVEDGVADGGVVGGLVDSWGGDAGLAFGGAGVAGLDGGVAVVEDAGFGVVGEAGGAGKDSGEEAFFLEVAGELGPGGFVAVDDGAGCSTGGEE